MNKNFKYQVIDLQLGEDYLIVTWGVKAEVFRLIQPTQKGYNFLNLTTSKCLLKHHLYPSKKFGKGSRFLVGKWLIIKRINGEQIKSGT